MDRNKLLWGITIGVALNLAGALIVQLLPAATRTVAWMFQTSNTTAAWVQAIGTIVAIAATAWIALGSENRRTRDQQRKQAARVCVLAHEMLPALHPINIAHAAMIGMLRYTVQLRKISLLSTSTPTVMPKFKHFCAYALAPTIWPGRRAVGEVTNGGSDLAVPALSGRR